MSMWRASMWRRMALLSVVAAGAYGATFLGVGPQPDGGYQRATSDDVDLREVGRQNLEHHFFGRFGLILLAGGSRLELEPEGRFETSRDGKFWFTAKEGEQGKTDVFVSNVSLSKFGIPVAVSPPINLTQSPLGEESVLDSRLDRLLVLVRTLGAEVRVRLFEFSFPAEKGDGAVNSALNSIEALQRFGRSEMPTVYEFKVSGQPSGEVRGRLEEAGFTLHFDKRSVTVDLRRGTVTPSDGGTLLPTTDGPSAPWNQFWTVLARSEIFGVERLVDTTRLALSAQDWVESQLYLSRPTAIEAPGAESAAVSRGESAWPPSAIEVESTSALPGEGAWRAVTGDGQGSDPPILKTFVRVDEQRPQQRVWLFAFDMRRLGLGFVAGVEEPPTRSGARGHGRVPDMHRQYVVGRFSGGLSAHFGDFGVVEGGTVVVPPVPGAATIALDGQGQAALGIWDVDGDPEPWQGVRQSLPALVEQGMVRPRAVSGWGQRLHPLDEVRMTRSAIGVTGRGVLIYSWAEHASAHALGLALKSANVEFAVHLDVGGDGNGLELKGAKGGRPAAPRMDLSSRGWHGTAKRDFFYLYRAGRVARFVDELPGLDADRRLRRYLQLVDGIPAVARVDFSAVELSTSDAVRGFVMDGDLTRPHFVPGLAERRPSEIDGRRALVLPKAPIAQFVVGLRASRSPYGLTVERRAWSKAQQGVMTLLADAKGEVSIARFGARPSHRRIRWSTLIQGPTLLDNGQLGDDAVGATGLPAIGVCSDGNGLIGVLKSERGDRPSLAKAMQKLSCKDGLLLTEQGTADTGRMRFYFERGGEMFGFDGLQPQLEKTTVSPTAGNSIMLTSRRRESSVTPVSTFMRVRISRSEESSPVQE